MELYFMKLESIDGVAVPLEFQTKYGARRSHVGRVKSCGVCPTRYYDVSPRNHTKACPVCSLKAAQAQLDVDARVTPEKAATDPLRERVCIYCATVFIDLSLPNRRVYCVECLATYPREFLQKATHGTKIKSPIEEHESKIQELYELGLTDSQIATRCPPLKEHHVRLFRIGHGLPSRSQDDRRVMDGFPSVKDAVHTSGITLAQMSRDFGVARFNLRKILRQNGTFRPFESRDFKFDETQMSVLIGCVLGDGCISGVHRKSGTARCTISNKYAHKEYVLWKKAMLGESFHRIKIETKNTKNGRKRSLLAISRSARNFYDLYTKMYKPELKEKFGSDGYKAPDNSIWEELTPLSLAIFYQDDGNKPSEKGPSIAFKSPGSDIDVICAILRKKFDIEFYCRKSGKENPAETLRVRYKDSRKFFGLVAPYVHPVMAYKLPKDLRKEDHSSYDLLDSDSFLRTQYDALDAPGRIQFRDQYIRILQKEGFPEQKFTGNVDNLVWKLQTTFLGPLTKKEKVKKLEKRSLNLFMDDPEPGKYCNQESRDLPFLDEYFPHRFTASHVYRKSAVEGWMDNNLMQAAFQLMIDSENEIQFSPRVMRQNIIHLIRAPGHFRPHAAASIINHYNPRSVLDPFIGWGGRALASMVCPSVKRYVGIDLQKESVDGVLKMQETLASLANTQIKVIHGDAIVEMGNVDGKFDMILTSPPFWRAEVYNGIEQTGSLEKWFESFITPFAQHCKNLLAKNGVMLMHMEDPLGKPLYAQFNRALLGFNLVQTGMFEYNKENRISKQRMIHIYKHA